MEMNNISHKRAILTENLMMTPRDWNIARILEENEETNWSNREFNTEYNWSLEKATFFIESIFLKCEIQPLILFRDNGKTVICDGLQRLTALSNFFNNELVLSAVGLKKMPFLAGKKFKDLPKDYQSYLLYECKLKVRLYTPKRPELPLTLDDNDFIEKQLYIRYNSGIQLKNFQIQKALFHDEDITIAIKKLLLEEKFYQKWVVLKAINHKKRKDTTDLGMVKIRELIASTYCPLGFYLQLKSSKLIINKGYAKYLKEENPEAVIENFKKTTKKLYEIFTSPLFFQNEKLNTYCFTDCTYWLISTIIKDNLFPLDQLNVNKYLEYCVRNDHKESYFDPNLYSTKTKKDRYQYVSQFVEKMYSISMNRYFEQRDKIDKKIPDIEEIPLVEDLKKRQYTVDHRDNDVKDICKLMSQNRFMIRPPYQRNEQKRVREASAIIESIFMDVVIPDIMIYRYFKNGKDIYEVVDGQQRLLSLISYVGEEYLDENGEYQKSEKHNFALEKLKIFKDCNGNTYNDSEKKLAPYFRDKLKKFDIHLAVIDQSENPHFDPVDHYIRINMNITPLPPHSYTMWNVSCDKATIDKINEVAKKHHHNLFLHNSNNKAYEQIITTCSYHDFQSKKRKNDKIRNWRKVSGKDITSWLEMIEDHNRIHYFESIENVDSVLMNIEKWLEFMDKEPNELFGLKKYAKVSINKFSLLYYLLADFDEQILLKKSSQIYVMLNDFYRDVIKVNRKQIDTTVENLISETMANLKLLKVNYISDKSYV